MSWPKTCVDCAKESDVAKCPGCGNTKPIEEETVTDTVVVKELEKFDRKITARIEKNLDERDK